MATITPVAFYTGSTIAGTTQVGNLSVGTSAQDYGEVGPNNGITYWATPDQNNGYVIAHDDLSASHTGNTVVAGVQTKVPGQKVGFWRSLLLTENSFVQLTNTLFNQSFTAGSQCNTYLTSNGMWSSYVDTYHYDSASFLSWPASSAGYTLYTGGFNQVDDGYSNSPITLPTTFSTNGQSSTDLYLSTNGYFTLISGSNGIYGNPQAQSNPALMCGNPGDNFLQPGLTNDDGDVQNWYYQTGSDGGTRFYAKLLVYCGTCCGGSATYPKSYIINFYIDGTYQWLETRIKSNSAGSAGPYNNTGDVSQGASTTSRVWRGDLNGQNWVYMGTGTVQP